MEGDVEHSGFRDYKRWNLLKEGLHGFISIVCMQTIRYIYPVGHYIAVRWEVAVHTRILMAGESCYY